MTKKIDFDKAILKGETVTEIPVIAHRGAKSRNYSAMIDLVMQKGLLRYSEDDLPINSIMTGLKNAMKLPENKDKQINMTTRRVNGKVYLYLQKPYKNIKK